MTRQGAVKRTALAGLLWWTTAAGAAAQIVVPEGEKPVRLNPPGERQPFVAPATPTAAADQPASSLAMIRIPPVVGNLEDRDIVLFAAGAVELRPPLEWEVREAAVGREVRVLLTPSTPRNPRGLLVDGMWLVYHPEDAGGQSPPSAAARLDARLAQFTAQGARLASRDTLMLGGYEALRHDFQFDHPRDGRRRGFHAAINAPGGVCEIHAVAPAELHAQRSVQFEQTLHSLVLREPAQRIAPVNENAQHAEPILGSWKAYRCRLRLSGDGRIEIVTDPPVSQPIGSAVIRSGPAPIVGRYVARDDLLHVEWDDGSKLNFRWRLAGGRLLLTDHEGQISQLKRILE